MQSALCCNLKSAVVAAALQHLPRMKTQHAHSHFTQKDDVYILIQGGLLERGAITSGVIWCHHLWHSKSFPLCHVVAVNILLPEKRAWPSCHVSKLLAHAASVSDEGETCLTHFRSGCSMKPASGSGSWKIMRSCSACNQTRTVVGKPSKVQSPCI